MEVNPTHRPIVFVKAIQERSHLVVPELDYTRVQGRQNPWSLRVKAEALDTVALRFELGQHFCSLFLPSPCAFQPTEQQA